MGAIYSPRGKVYRVFTALALLIGLKVLSKDEVKVLYLLEKAVSGKEEVWEMLAGYLRESGVSVGVEELRELFENFAAVKRSEVKEEVDEIYGGEV